MAMLVGGGDGHGGASLSWYGAATVVSDHRVTLGIAFATVVGLIAIRRWANGGKCTSKAQLNNMTAIVTGANTGIGKETAKDLASRGARVILACRDMQRGNRAASDITQQTGNTNVVVRKLDLSSFDSVRQFAEGVLDTEPRIHILVNNAAWVGQFAQTDEGIEMQWQVNHLSHFLLTNLLLERMKASSPSRIVNVSSRAHAWAKSLDMEAIRTETAATHNKYIAYARSKLANVLFTRELSRRLKGTGVTVNALHPGGVQTELGRRMPKLMRFIMIVLLFPILLLFVKTSRQGAQTSIYLAVSEEVDGVTGHYFSDCAVKDASAMARDDDLARRLWEHSASMTAL